MSSVFEVMSSVFGRLTGFYSYGYRKDEPGIYINEAIAENFGLHSGMMSEGALNDFVMRSIGGVNGRKMRHGEGLLFRKVDGRYVTVTYDPMKKGKRGYVQEHRLNKASGHKKISDLPNFARLVTNAEYHSGNVFFVLNITPYEYHGDTFDYACIAEFFDKLRRELTKPAVHWIGGREYVVMVKPEERELFLTICGEPVELNGKSIPLSISRITVEPQDTATDHAEKLEFCAKRLRAGISGRDYIFSAEDFEKYRKMPKLHETVGAIDRGDISFLPAVAVKTGYVKYFYVVPRADELAEHAWYSGLDAELDIMLIRSLTAGLADGILPQTSYCVPAYSGNIDVGALSVLCSSCKEKIYIELHMRSKRYEDSADELIASVKNAGAIPLLADNETELCSLDGVRRMGIEGFRITEENDEIIKGTADFCRTFGLDCAVFGADSDEKFIKLRRYGVDVAAGAVLSEKVELPEKMRFAEPQILCDEEPEPIERKPFDLTRFCVKIIYNTFKDDIKKLSEIDISPDPIVPTAAEPAEPLGESDLEPLEYAEGIGAKKKRKEAVTDKAQRKRQKKEIKQGKLKKTKKMKLDQ